MRPVWVNAKEALRHNQAQSIQRETFMLELIARKQLPELASTPA